MITLRTFEFVIPFGTEIQLRILDDNDYYIGSYNFQWPYSGGYLNYEVVDLWPCFDKRIGDFLMFRVKAPKSDA